MSSPTPPTDRFLDESVLADFTALRMTAFGRSVIDIANDPARIRRMDVFPKGALRTR